MSITLAMLNVSHAAVVAAIMDRHSREGFASFFEAGPSEAAAAVLIDRGGALASTAAIIDGNVIGFGMLRPFHHPAPAFRGTAEISYFLAPEATGRGVGTLLLDHLLHEGAKRGVKRVLAEISSLNEQSLAFHAKRGFVERGRFPDAGRKFGESFDLVWMTRALDE